MNIEITDQAFEWFKEELELSNDDNVQFFVRYGGCGDFQTGFSLGVTVKKPDDPAVKIKKNGVHFYIERKDEWYFDNKDLKVAYDPQINEIKYLHN
ncbi:HesB/YadR/YfhF family protein [Evansella sp. AB-P1]|uniref:HesB/YadR/YfhF family protein n=1 Tax=Evansella sp. AB-P1 TaxID=3037653 RepID=UPI00241E816C|nr:HesB/YadR/YfhF family protein [Evansella sp. AB-P1]MDG5789168.1 HesB/YadR/YfhF family protein [Evansella sp. AB-P1]